MERTGQERQDRAGEGGLEERFNAAKIAEALSKKLSGPQLSRNVVVCVYDRNPELRTSHPLGGAGAEKQRVNSQKRARLTPQEREARKIEREEKARLWRDRKARFRHAECAVANVYDGRYFCRNWPHHIGWHCPDRTCAPSARSVDRNPDPRSALAPAARYDRHRHDCSLQVRSKSRKGKMALAHLGIRAGHHRLVDRVVGVSYYLQNFADYNATYGTLGAVIGFMMWTWISVIILLVGAELNAELEHQTARDSTIGPPLPMGDRGAFMADTVGKASDETIS